PLFIILLLFVSCGQKRNKPTTTSPPSATPSVSAARMEGEEEETYEVTGIHKAVLDNDLEEVKRILAEDKKQVNRKDPKGFTPLHFAAEIGNIDIATHLLDQGAIIGVVNESGWSVMHNAARTGQLDMAMFLVTRGAKTDVPSKMGWTPMHIAAANNQLKFVKFLVEQNADMNARNVDGWTPLHRAAANGAVETVQYLLDENALADEKTSDGLTPLILANKGGHTQVAHLLTVKIFNIDVNPTPMNKEQIEIYKERIKDRAKLKAKEEK
ncbi:MAG: ankyrin repeat domain-containing protein, partial [Vulcanimicrobiota bacterium]